MTEETLGRYRLLRKLATGGMAEIWLAAVEGPEGFHKQLVIKRILPNLAEDEEFVRMFLDEARIAARLNHPNIGQIFELGEEHGSFYLAMEFIPGKDLRRMYQDSVKAGTPLPIPLTVRVLIEAAQALDYAHSATDDQGRPLQIVHRDVSPQNILVTFRGGVKLVDFGIAKAADQASHTRVGVLKGKYSYMSPEQAAGDPLDGRSDLFALGVVGYELVTGFRLFKRDNEIATLQAVRDCQVAPPSSVSPQVPRSLDRILLKALSKEPEERYRTAGQLALALEEFLLLGQYPASGTHLAEFMRTLYPETREEGSGAPASSGSQPSHPSGGSTDRRLPVHGPVAPTDRTRTGGRLAGGAPDAIPIPIPVAPPDREPPRAKTKAPAKPTAVKPPRRLESSGPSASARRSAEPPSSAVRPSRVIEPVLEAASDEEVPEPDRRSWRWRPSSRLVGRLAVAALLLAGGLFAWRNLPGMEGWLAQSPSGGAVRADASSDAGSHCLLCGFMPERQGKLTVVTQPSAVVYLGKEALGATPLVELPVPAGKLELRLVNESAALDAPIEVEIRPDQLSTVRREFPQGTVALSVPKAHACHVYFHDKPLGQLPGPPIQLVEGVHTLTIVDDRTGEKQERSVTVRASKHPSR